MAAMTPRERVVAALRHREPDRVPLVLWGSYYSLNDDTYFNLLGYLGVDEPTTPFREHRSRNSNYYDDRVLDLLDTDARYVWSGFTDLGGADLGGDGVDAWGVRWKRSGPYVVASDPPLGGATAQDVEAHQWPEPLEYLDFDLMEQRLETLQAEYPNHAVGARAVNSYGPFEQAAALCGRERFYMDLVVKPELARLVVDHCTDVIVRAQEAYLRAVGDYVDFFEIPGDDYGTSEGLMISPVMFRTFFKPAITSIVRTVKDYREDLPVVFHSDGAIVDIIPDLVECGVDVLNPMEPLLEVDWAAVNERYGDQLCFMGGVDIKQAMTGPVAGVAEEVRRRIKIFGPGGGYLLTSANHLQPDVPPENIVKMCEACREFGQYPL